MATEPDAPSIEYRNLSPYEMFLERARAQRPRHAYRPGTDVADWRQRALPDVLNTLGRRPEPVEPRPELVAEWRRGEVVTQRWLLDLSDRFAGYAYVSRPAALPTGERRPVLLCWHGHGHGGKEVVMGNDSTPPLRDEIEQTNASYGSTMAAAGFITCAVDWMGHGDMNDATKPHHRNVIRQRDPCNLYYLAATMLGMTPMGINVEHGRRLLDFVTDLPFADHDRIGVMGLSGGGAMALWSALADERISAVELICYSDLFADFAFRDFNACGSQLTPGLLELVDVPDLQGLLCPRPLLVDIGAFDACFRVESATACAVRVEQIYTHAGAGEQFEVELFPGGHAWPDARSRAFFGRHLDLPA